MPRILTRIAIAIGSLISAPALADDWAREVAGWDVGRVGDTCAMVMEYEGEGATRLGLLIRDNAEDTYLVVTNYGWSAKEGETYELKYHLGKWVYTLSSVGIEQDIIRKGFLTFASNDFLSEFAKSNGLTITRNDTLVDDLSLKGSAAALLTLERCRRELAGDLAQQLRDKERLQHIPKDPFAGAIPAAPKRVSQDQPPPDASQNDTEFGELFNALAEPR